MSATTSAMDDALFGQIAELEATNREADRKYLALSQKFFAAEREKQSYRDQLLQAQEQIAQLREELSSRKLEYETENKVAARLRSQVVELKSRLAEQFKHLEEQRQGYVRDRKAHVDGLKKNNAAVREAIAALTSHDRCRTRGGGTDATTPAAADDGTRELVV